MLRILLACYFPFLAILWLSMASLMWLLLARGLFLFVPVLLFMVLLTMPLVQIPWACRVLFWRLPEGASEVRIARKRMRQLFALVNRVAEERQLPAPDRIRFQADTVAHVYRNCDGERVLVLGGVAMHLFSQKDLTGIIAHELGHFAAGDTELSRRCYRRRLVMMVLESNLVLWIRHRPIQAGQFIIWMPMFCLLVNLLNPVPWLIVAYHRLFELLYARHLREQEFAADRQSVQQSGKESAAECLVFMHALPHSPWMSLDGIATSHFATNTHLGQIFSEQVSRAARIERYDWEKACRKALAARTRWNDDHPCLRERLAAIGVSSKEAMQMMPSQSGPPATELVEDWADVEKRMTGQLMGLFHEQYQLQQDMAQVAQHLAHRRAGH